MSQPELFRTFRLPSPPSAVKVKVKKTKEPPLTAKELEFAREHLRKLGRCYHDPPHDHYTDCVTAVAKALRGYR